MPKKRRRRHGECAYCGVTTELTDEHVFPQCLVERPLPADMIEVGVCHACNNLKSRDDDYLRDILVGDMRVSDDLAARLFEGPVKRSIGYGSSVAGRTAQARPPAPSVRFGNGPEFVIVSAVAVDTERIQRIFSAIVRGLHYREFNERLPDGRVFEIQQLDPATEDINATIQRFQDFGSTVSISCGGACGHVAWRSADKARTAWLIWFYRSESHVYYVATHPPADGLSPSVKVFASMWLPSATVEQDTSFD